MKVLSPDFYNRKTLKVAHDLLGKYIVRETHGHRLVGKIVEVEAYIGSIDKGAHSYKYKKNPPYGGYVRASGTCLYLSHLRYVLLS